MLLVDNAITAFCNQTSNGIPIIPFTNQKDDKELLDLAHFLRELNSHQDFRIFIEDYFNTKVYDKKEEISGVIEEFRN